MTRFAHRGKLSPVAQLLQTVKCAAIITAVWALALVAAVSATASMIEHHQLRRDVAVLKQDYDREVQEYASLQAEGDRIENDHQYQIELLKKRFGYTEPDETPIVILPD